MSQSIGQPSDEAPPAPSSQGPAPEAALLAEELAILRKLASGRKRWWQDYSLLIAGMAFSLSLGTSIISAWTSYRKDIHDQQAQLASHTKSMQDLSIQLYEVSQKYKDTPDVLNVLNTLLVNQLSTEINSAISLALKLGTNATTGELVTIALNAGGLGKVTETIKLLDLAASAANSAIEKAYALGTLGGVLIRVGGSPEMVKEGNNTFEKAMHLDLDPQYHDDLEKLPSVNSFIKIGNEERWAAAFASRDCAQSMIHHVMAVDYLSQVPQSDLVFVTTSLSAIGVPVQGTSIGPPPGCPETVAPKVNPTDEPQPKKAALP